MRNWLMIAAAALALAGCKAGETPGADGRSDRSAAPLSQSDAEKVVGEAYAAFTSGDAMQMMAHYAPDAVVVDGANNEPTNDRSRITKWTADFAAMKPSDLTTNPRFVQSLDGDTIVSSGIGAFLIDVGGRRQRVSMRYTHVFEKQADGRWLIVAEHNSVPPQPVSTGL